jgi:opacity protein-like surface antigen
MAANRLYAPGARRCVFPTVSETRNGWTIGVGGEYAFLDWLTGFIEYDYYGFRDNNNTVGFTCGTACPIATVTTFPVNNRNQ